MDNDDAPLPYAGVLKLSASELSKKKDIKKRRTVTAPKKTELVKVTVQAQKPIKTTTPQGSKYIV